MLGRVVHKADFERLLATRSRARSTHFAVHHVSGSPFRPLPPALRTVPVELSTSPVPLPSPLVDNVAAAVWIGCVVPKRHAKRAVTRNLLKRQIRACFSRHAAALPGGLWLVRLRAGFPVADFVSARSAALAQAAGAELDGLLGRAG